MACIVMIDEDDAVELILQEVFEQTGYTAVVAHNDSEGHLDARLGPLDPGPAVLRYLLIF